MCQNNIPIPKVKVAENLVDGVRYLAKRDILADISMRESEFKLACRDANYLDCPIEWVKIGQVGICEEFTSHQYYSAIQKVLLSCHKPESFQFVFMIYGDGEKLSLYMGIRQLEVDGDNCEAMVEGLSAFVSDILPGTNAQYIGRMNESSEEIRENIKDRTFKNLYAFTGIPSFLGKEGEESISSIDMIIGPLSKKKFVYFVVADPVDENKGNSVFSKCLEMSGKLESIKTSNISETYNASTTIGESKGFSKSITENHSDAVNRKGKKHHFWSKLMCTIGLGDFIDQSTRTISSGNSETTNVGENRSDTLGNSATTSMTLVNKNAEHAAGVMSKHAARFEKGLGLGLWETGVYLMTEDAHTGQSAALQLKAVISGNDTSLEPVRIHDLSILMNQRDNPNALSLKTAVADLCIPDLFLLSRDGLVVKSNFDENKDENLTTCLTTEELSCIVNLPQKSVPGISVIDYSINFSLTPQKFNTDKVIEVGQLVYSGSKSNIKVSLPINTLSGHVLVCGVNGSGKTNTVLSILDGLMKENKPFFVIEPAKTEYVDWAIDYNKKVSDPNKKIKIFIPGCGKYKGEGNNLDDLKINPFEVIQLPGSEMRVLTRIDHLKSSFASAFPMQDILPVIMEHLLHKLYTDKCPLIDEDDRNTEMNRLNKTFPTLKSIDDEFIKDIMDEMGYARENTQNISAALRTRLRSLNYGWKGQLLNNPKLTGMTWDELFGSPVVVNLSYAGDDQDRAFIMSLLLLFLYEYRTAESESVNFSFNTNECRHLVVVEEAHRVMVRNDNPESPQHKSGLIFSNFLSEARAYGQGMMIVDQVPTRLIEDAIKNTNVKIIHKLVASDDSQRIAECIGLTKEQQKVIAKLSRGQAVLAGFNSASIASDNSSDIYMAQINKMK